MIFSSTMTIRVRLIAQTVFLQVIALLLLAYGVFAVQHSLGERDVERAETQIRLAVARTANESLIQKDQVQLLSSLNFLKVQYPALAYARTVWTNGDKSATQSLGTAEGAHVLERRVKVSDPSDESRAVEVFFGVDQDALRSTVRESQHRMVKILALVGAITALISLILAILLSRSLTRSLTALGRMAEQISEGRLGVHLEWSTEDEIGALVRVFNNMSARLADLDTSKKNFVSSVTHELRSPLGAIESFLPLIREKVSTGEPEALAQAMEYMDRIESNVHRLNRFITDLLDVAKIEQGKMECVIRRLEVGPIAAEVAQFFEAKAAAQGVTIENRVNGEPAVMGDSDRIRQVLVNLVANGLKFTPSGGRVWISAQPIKDAGQRWLQIAVGDTGKGMDEADRQRLFRPFSQGRNISESVAGPKGTGLGLYIVKSIVDQHGGKVDVQSVPGQGTQISFCLKIAG
jgi:signal transduction histidine kinase